MNYITIKEAAAKWGISERTVQSLCTAGRIEGAGKFGASWAIPENAQKPTDPRRGRAATADCSDMAEPTAKKEYIAMPLVNSAFEAGKCREYIESIEDDDAKSIALAEYYYFSGRAELASEIAERYLLHKEIPLRLSACWIYAYANLALDRILRTREAMADIQLTLQSLDGNTSPRDRALTVCVSTAAAVLLHLPLPKILAPLKDYIHILSPGLRLFVLYIQAHHAYLNKQYGASVGIAETALALEGERYPIPEIYLHLVATMGYMSLRQPEAARAHFLEAWDIAKKMTLLRHSESTTVCWAE